jgi:hypothetical protein
MRPFGAMASSNLDMSPRGAYPRSGVHRPVHACLLWFAVASLLPATAAVAYVETTHQLLSNEAVVASALTTDPSLLQNLGLPAASDLSSSYTTTTGIGGLSAAGIIALGSVIEDGVALPTRPADQRFVNHFLDPQFVDPNSHLQTGRGLSGVVSLGANASPTWALGDRGDPGSNTLLFYNAQTMSYMDAQGAFFSALVSSTRASRTAALSQMFQSLGQVIHHIQDMAQPQHTRDDSHGSSWSPSGSPPSSLGLSYFYEPYTANNITAAGLHQILLSNPYPTQAPMFDLVRQYWYTPDGNGNIVPARRVGMAEFSAQNFLTMGSMPEFVPTQLPPIIAKPGFPLPSGSGTSLAVLSEAVTWIDGSTTVGPTKYLLGSVTDDYIGSTTSNVRLAAVSLLSNFAPRVTAFSGRTGLVENSSVFLDRYRFLFPRAVAFSAGLINHFFRARINVRRNGTSPGWVIDNLSDRAIQGAFYLYVEDSAGTRTLVPGGAYATPTGTPVAPQATVPFTFPEPAGSPVNVVAVFAGTLVGGDPAGPANFANVAGKVVPYTPPPVACAGPFKATDSSTGFDNKSALFDLGTTAGPVQLEFEAYAIPDGIRAESANAAKTSLVAYTGLISGYHLYTINYNPAALGSTKIHVVVTGNADTATRWDMAMSCPGGQITNADRVDPRVLVTFAYGGDNPAGEQCGFAAYLDGVYAGGGSAGIGTVSFSVLLTTGNDVHSLTYQNVSCTPLTPWGSWSARYQDRAGWHNLPGLGNVGIIVQ